MGICLILKPVNTWYAYICLQLTKMEKPWFNLHTLYLPMPKTAFKHRKDASHLDHLPHIVHFAPAWSTSLRGLPDGTAPGEVDAFTSFCFCHHSGFTNPSFSRHKRSVQAVGLPFTLRGIARQAPSHHKDVVRAAHMQESACMHTADTVEATMLISTSIYSCFALKKIIWLGGSTPLKDMKVSWEYEIPNMWENKSHVPNHQPVMTSLC